MTTEQSATVLVPDQTAEAAKPTPKTFTEEDLRKQVSAQTSKFQRDQAAANKRAKALEAQVGEMQSKIALAEEDARVARLAGDDEEAGTRIRERMRYEKQLDERESRLKAWERTTAITMLSQQYGIPQDDLEEYETAAQMEGAAKDFKLKQLEERIANASRNGSAEEETPPKKPGFATSGGKSAPPNQEMMKMALSKDPKEQAKFEEIVQGAMRKR